MSALYRNWSIMRRMGIGIGIGLPRCKNAFEWFSKIETGQVGSYYGFNRRFKLETWRSLCKRLTDGCFDFLCKFLFRVWEKNGVRIIPMDDNVKGWIVGLIYNRKKNEVTASSEQRSLVRLFSDNIVGMWNSNPVSTSCLRQRQRMWWVLATLADNSDSRKPRRLWCVAAPHFRWRCFRCKFLRKWRGRDFLRDHLWWL